MYHRSCKTDQPYAGWYSDIDDTHKHIKERCKEIETKFSARKAENKFLLEQEYAKSTEDGMIFEQHDDMGLDIRKKCNTELIGLISEMKSTVEKIIRSMLEEYKIKGKKTNESYISYGIRMLEEQKNIDMIDYADQRKTIDAMNKKRNDYEHELDNLLFDESVDFIVKFADDSSFFMENLIRKLYESKA